jgi:Phytanoyl-CoA dioxygenase (PhyH)
MFRLLAHVARKNARNGGAGWLSRFATRDDYKQHENWLQSVQPIPKAIGAGVGYLAQLEATGICIVENFWSRETCALARDEVDRVIAQYPKYVNGNAKADQRVYGANNASQLIASFADYDVLASVASAYNREPTRTAFSLAARMPMTSGNQGSGDGWHRDAFLRQFKAILYLSDVGPDNGPFQMIADSHRHHRVLADMRAGQLKYMQYRLTEQEIERIIASEPERKITYTAKAGTLILADTSTLHRGKPIEAGTRYALTNYYFPESRIENGLYEKFDVLPIAAVVS